MTPKLDKTVEIHFNKIKLILVALGCVVFVVIGVSILLKANNSRLIFIFDKLVSIIGIAFFGLGFIVIIKALFDRRPALIINADGLILYSVINKSQFIPWNIIKRFNGSIHNNLLIIIKNPKKVINDQKGLMRKLAKLSYQMSGSPYSINCTCLKANIPELEKLLTEKHDEFKTNKQLTPFINPL